MTGRRRAARAALALVGVTVVAGVAGEATGWPFLQRPLRDALQRAAGVPVQLDGRFRVHLLWRPRLQIEHLTVGAAPDVPAPHLIDGRRVTLGWRWADIWRWRRGEALTLRSLGADALDVHLVRLADGRASWQIGHQQRAVKQPGQPQPLPRVGRLQVADGHIAIDDHVLDTQLRIDVRGGEGAGQDESEMRAPNGYHATIGGRYRALPLKLTIRSGGALPLLRDADDDEDRAAMTPLRVEGELGNSRVIFDGQAAALMGARHIDGAIRFSGPSLATVGEPLGLTLLQTPPFSLLGRVAHHNGVWTLRTERATIGRSELAGEFRYDTHAKPPRLSGNATGPQLRLADLGPAIGAPTGGAAPPSGTASAPRGYVLPRKRFDLPSLSAMNADVQLAIDQLVFSTSAMTPLRGLRTHVLLDGGVLELQGLQAEVAGGRVSGTTRLDARSQPARWAAQLRFGGVDVAGWVRGVRTAEGERKAPSSDDAQALRRQREAARRGAEQKAPAYLTGELAASVDVTGAGHSTAEILSTLEGPIHATVREGTMSHLVTEALGVDVAQALGVMIKGDDALPLRCARLDFETHGGVMKLTRGVFDNPDSTIRVAGQLDLRTEQLALAARARPKDVSPVSLRSPITVSGTLQSPKVGIEPSTLGVRALGALALGALAGPLAAVIPLVDPGEAEQGDPCVTGNSAEASPKPSRSAATKNERVTR
ncbi:MAG TPA: AsmA family protein [Burkholderiaceae bacterium]|nr:AsmA family protein [Burkholderiaceae bacterium]